MIAHLPGRVMINAVALATQPSWQNQLAKHWRASDHAQRAGTANYLVRLKEFRYGQCGSYGSQSLYVTRLRKNSITISNTLTSNQKFMHLLTYQNLWMAAEELGKGQFDLFA